MISQRTAFILFATSLYASALPLNVRIVEAQSALKLPSSTTRQHGGTHHTVFSLDDNRLLGHLLYQKGLVIPLGHPGAVKYLNFARPWNPWILHQRIDRKRVIVAKAPTTWLTVPLVENYDAASLALRVYSPSAQNVTITINGKSVGKSALTSGWQTATLPISRNLLTRGEHRIELRWAQKGAIDRVQGFAAVEWIYIGPQGKEPQAETSIELSKPKTQGFSLHNGQGIGYFVFPYSSAKLHVRAEFQERCALAVRILPEPGARTVAAIEKRVEGTSGVRELVVDFGHTSEQVSWLELTATGDDSCKRVAIVDAAIVMPGPQPVVTRAHPPQNVLFWLIDNARADRYKVYNPTTRVKTPVIQTLGETGTVFTNAYVQGTESRVSHASIWTGLYPKQHNFIAAKARLSLDWKTLPETLQQHGLFTAAWIANGFVSEFWGFGEGWNSFHNLIHERKGLSGEAIAGHAEKFIAEQAARRFYLYLGTIDVHVSWRAQEPWLSDYHPEPYQGRFIKTVFGADVEGMAVGRVSVSDADRKRIVAIYDSTVSYNDAQLGRVLKALEKQGIRDRTMIVVTADHGEELWDFGGIGHGHSLRQPVVAVPLIVHYPPLFGSGVRVRENVNVASVMATILDAMNAPQPPHLQGASLLPLAQGVGRGYPRPSIATQYELAHAMQLEHFKLWIGGKGDAKLYNLKNSDGERREIAAQSPWATRWLTDCLGTFLFYQHAWREARWGVASNHLPSFANDLEQNADAERIQPGP